jgi:hypothetical protein
VATNRNEEIKVQKRMMHPLAIFTSFQQIQKLLELIDKELLQLKREF